MVEIDEALVVKTGIEGDVYAEGNGTWQIADRKKPLEKPKDRAISCLSLQDLKKGNMQYGTSLEPIDTRRNFVFDGPNNIQQYIGRTIQIGKTVQIRLTDDCDSCSRPSKLSGKAGYEKHGKLGGVRGVPIEGTPGKVKKGDDVYVI